VCVDAVTKVVTVLKPDDGVIVEDDDSELVIGLPSVLLVGAVLKGGLGV
jgi:hypothetical protein